MYLYGQVFRPVPDSRIDLMETAMMESSATPRIASRDGLRALVALTLRPPSSA